MYIYRAQERVFPGQVLVELIGYITGKLRNKHSRELNIPGKNVTHLVALKYQKSHVVPYIY